MRHSTLALLILASSGCAELRGAEYAGSWYEDEGDLDVTEPIAFTDVNYDFTGPDAIEELPYPPAGSGFSVDTWFAAEDALPAADCGTWDSTAQLPDVIEGIVTIHPRYYFKTSGCLPNFDFDSDEKYYGSFFVQDATGGVFVLGDSKVAHFDMGDRVKLRVRGTALRFDLPMVVAHDVIEIQRGPEPIYYEVAEVEWGPNANQSSDGDPIDVMGRVKRVTGTVLQLPDTFGEFRIQTDDGRTYTVGLDSELNRRGLSFDPGTVIQVTGPVLYSFDTHRIAIMRVGQITVL